MQNFLSLWLNAGAQITHGGQSFMMKKKMKKIGFIYEENHKFSADDKI